MGESWRQKYLRALPAVDVVLGIYRRNHPQSRVKHETLVQGIQQIIDGLRKKMLLAKDEQEMESVACSPEEVAGQLEDWLSRLTEPSLRPVINATGTVLHTNLGRAPLSESALLAVQNAAGYCNLELNLQDGRRGSRHDHVEKLLVQLTGAEAACVVNNNAAAVLLCLSTVAAGKNVIVSRGELVEIGGSFRIPEVMAAGGARLVEVGTTNKTYLRDYRNAIDENTALLLKVHTSNYKIVGFTASVDSEELVALGREYGLPVMEDLGSGLFIDLSAHGLEKEPLVTERVAAGLDLVTMSGDKLLGGPQAGLILGKKDLVERIKKNPLMRALRPDKLTLAALEATLKIYLCGDPLAEIPVLSMLTVPLGTLERRARRLAEKLRAGGGGLLSVTVREDFSYVGGGAMPLTKLPTFVMAVKHKSMPVSAWAEKLRLAKPALVGRIQDDFLLLDPRTFKESQEEEVVRCLTS